MIGALILVCAALALAKPIARWVAGNTGSTGSRTPLPPLSRFEDCTPAEQKSRQLQEQVSAKIHWDAPEREVLEWLGEKHGIEGERAQAMLAIARQARVRAIRERSLYGLMAAGIGMIATATPLVIEVLGGFVFVLRSTALIAAFGFCGFWFGKYLIRFLKGTTDGTVDS
jgi:hypothetical protein